MNMPFFIYLFYSWWTSGFFPVWGFHEQTCYELLGHVCLRFFYGFAFYREQYRIKNWPLILIQLTISGWKKRVFRGHFTWWKIRSQFCTCSILWGEKEECSLKFERQVTEMVKVFFTSELCVSSFPYYLSLSLPFSFLFFSFCLLPFSPFQLFKNIYEFQRLS